MVLFEFGIASATLALTYQCWFGFPTQLCRDIAYTEGHPLFLFLLVNSKIVDIKSVDYANQGIGLKETLSH